MGRRLIPLSAEEPLTPPMSIEEIAAQQGVEPITDIESLLGHPSPEDETDEEFAAMLRSWRTEGCKESVR